MLSPSAGFVVWLTGLPCSGKSTLSEALRKKLEMSRCAIECLDGDLIRNNLSKDLDFSKEGREENIRRVAFVASLLSKHGVAVIVSLVSPYQKMRDHARSQIQNFIEIHVRCPLQVCETRDTKGHYKRARQGTLLAFTGISDPYETPKNPEIIVDTDKTDANQCVDQIMSFLKTKGYVI